MITAPIFLLFLPHLQLPGGAWERSWRVEGTLETQYLGDSLAAAGDVDGDGVDDLLVGGREGHPAGPDLGVAWLRSGKDGGLLWVGRKGTGGGLKAARAVAGLGDVDGDGVPDVVLADEAARVSGHSLAGVVEVWSPAQDRLLWRLSGNGYAELLGHDLARVGDVNGDGVDDLAVAASGGGAYGSLLMVSGRDGSLLWQASGTSAHREGRAVAAAGDFDGDGIPEVLSSDASATGAGGLHQGMVTLRSGASGAVLRQYPGPHAGATFGEPLCALDDLDGDGQPELLVAGPADDPAGVSNAGTVWMVSGGTGATIWSRSGRHANQHFGSALAAAGDADGDGLPEVLVAATDENLPGLSSAGVVRLLRAADGSLVHGWAGAAPAVRFGLALCGLGDLDGDGTAEIAVAMEEGPSSPPLNGAVEVHSLDPFLIPGAETLSLSGGPPVPLDLRFPAGEAGAAYLILASLREAGTTTIAGIEVPLGDDALLQAILAGAGPPWLLGGRGLLDAQASAQATLRGNPRAAALLGRRLWLAAISLDPLSLQGRLSSAARSLLLLP